jgi:hypothetical protein
MIFGVWALLATAISLVGFTWIVVLSFGDSKDPLTQDTFHAEKP